MREDEPNLLEVLTQLASRLEQVHAILSARPDLVRFLRVTDSPCPVPYWHPAGERQVALAALVEGVDDGSWFEGILNLGGLT